MTQSVWPGLAVAIVTFRREDGLLRVLRSVLAQSTHPGSVLVVDNSPDSSASEVTHAFAQQSPFEVRYLPLRRNTGPAGGFAAAIEETLTKRSRTQWLMCHDDDHEFEPGDIETMRAFVDETVDLSPVALGFRGARYSRTRGQSYRVPAEEVLGSRWVEVDAITGLGAPTYNLERLSRLSLNFDPDIFFGFEELDLGLRIKQGGGRLLTLSSRDLELRRQLGHANLRPFQFEPGKAASDWRSYFSHRNRTIVAKREAAPSGLLYLVARSMLKSVAELGRGLPGRARATLDGLRDGLLGRAPSERYIPR